MENTFWSKLEDISNQTRTTNGDVAYKSSLNGLCDMLFKAGIMKDQTDLDDMIKLFNKAWHTNPLYAIRLLFYARDVRGGQGCKLFFRTCMVYLSRTQPNVAEALIPYIAEYGAWSDVVELLKVPTNIIGRDFRTKLFTCVFTQLKTDLENLNNKKPISLLMKWLPSENASSKSTIMLAKEIRTRLDLTSCEYRKMLSRGRKYLDIVERKMCDNQFDKIDYETVPSVAMLNYKEAFAKHDEARFEKYLLDVNSGKKKINASVLYPYDVIKNVLDWDGRFVRGTDMNVVNAQWNALPDFFNGSSENSIVVADTSGSMSGIPIKVCLSLALYIAEHNHGKFHNKFITFSAAPELQNINGKNLEEKFYNLARADWGMNTNISKVYELLYKAVTPETVKDLPTSIYIISDMQFDQCVEDGTKSVFRYWKERFEKDLGIEMPKVIFWNVSECNSGTVPVTFKENGTILVSGFSPSILKFIMMGSSNTLQLIEDIVLSDRYKVILNEEQLKELIA